MTKHTPGPWEIVHLSANQYQLVSQGRGALLVRHDGSPEGIANMNIAVAAPDLLEALLSYLRAPSVGSDGPGSATIVVQEFNRRAARAAIAKAEGDPDGA